MQYDQTPRTGEIITAAETAAPGPIAEPLLTLSQLQGLLREAAALERAQRPIVMPDHQPYPVPAPDRYGEQDLTVNLTNVRYTTSSLAHLAPLPQVPETRSLAPLAFLVSGTAFIASAYGTTVTGGNPLLIASTLALLAATGAAFAHITGNGVNR